LRGTTLRGIGEDPDLVVERVDAHSEAVSQTEIERGRFEVGRQHNSDTLLIKEGDRLEQRLGRQAVRSRCGRQSSLALRRCRR
jgi:hypothetical protein